MRGCRSMGDEGNQSEFPHKIYVAATNSRRIRCEELQHIWTVHTCVKQVSSAAEKSLRDRS